MSDDNIIHLQQDQVTIACGREAIWAHLQRAIAERRIRIPPLSRRLPADEPETIAGIQALIAATPQGSRSIMPSAPAGSAQDGQEAMTDKGEKVVQFRPRKRRRRPTADPDSLVIRADEARDTLGLTSRCRHGVPLHMDCQRCHGIDDGDDNGPGAA